MAGARLDVQLAADQDRPLLHPEPAESAGRGGGRVEPHPVVLDHWPRLPPAAAPRGTDPPERPMASALSPRLPIGISDFRKLREPGILYVDKTDFVTRVLDSRAEVLLFPRPRRFGKTVNLSTLRYFLEKSPEDRSALFAGLSVSASAVARPHFQRYPVIALTFKDIKAGSFDAAFAAIRREIRRAYREHAYLLDEVALRPEDAASFQQILRAEGAEDLYAESLRELSLHLARYHGERVVIVIDEYDTPIHAASAPEDEHRLLTFFRAFFRSWLEQGLGGAGQVDELLQAILSGQAEVCERLLGQLLQSLSVHNVAGRRTAKKRPPRQGAEGEAAVDLTPEQIYHVFVVSLLLGLQSRYAVRSNRESGSGRYDVMVLPRTPGHPGVVIELKVRSRRKRETVKSAMTAALRQIHERGYTAELQACGAEPIHEIGIVFDGKQVWVARRHGAARDATARS